MECSAEHCNLGPQRRVRKKLRDIDKLKEKVMGSSRGLLTGKGRFFFPGLCNSHLQKDGHMGQKAWCYEVSEMQSQHFFGFHLTVKQGSFHRPHNGLTMTWGLSGEPLQEYHSELNIVIICPDCMCEWRTPSIWYGTWNMGPQRWFYLQYGNCWFQKWIGEALSSTCWWGQMHWSQEDSELDSAKQMKTANSWQVLALGCLFNQSIVQTSPSVNLGEKPRPK
jgi:hypothetical protein